MSIGTLGQGGERFRDFLSGGQKDLGTGLQNVLSSYQDPSGNFGRLNNRSRGMFELNNTEFNTFEKADSHNQWAEKWYLEYRAVLQMRADALKKKLSRAYTKVLERAIYAPMDPGTVWAPEANRDQNDIRADDPSQIFQGTTAQAGSLPPTLPPPIPSFSHAEWFSGTGGLGAPGGASSSGNAYDDIRRYINFKAPLVDLDGDGETIEWDDGASQYVNRDTTNRGSYGDLKNNSAFNDAKFENNLGPSVPIANFVASGGGYYITIAAQGEIAALNGPGPNFSWPDGGTPAGADTGHTFTEGFSSSTTFAFVGTQPTSGGPWTEYVYFGAGTKAYDPSTAPTSGEEGLFSGADTFPAPANNVVGGIVLNPKLTDPNTVNVSVDDASQLQNPQHPNLTADQKGFVDSWEEARSLQRREAQIEAAYTAYQEGSARMAACGVTMTYYKKMDMVFTGLDGLFPPGGGLGGGFPGGGSTNPPGLSNAGGAGTPYDSIVPYGYYLKDPTAGLGGPYSGTTNPIYGFGRAHNPTPGKEDSPSVYTAVWDQLQQAAAAGSGKITPPSGTTLPTGPSATTGGGNSPAPVTRAYATNDTGSGLYTPTPYGAADQGAAGGLDMSQPLEDTLNQAQAQAQAISDISNFFLGRQWDKVPGATDQGSGKIDGQGAVIYEAETIASHVLPLPGWYGGITDLLVGSALLTLTPPIDGLAVQNFAAGLNWGKLDDAIKTALGGSFLRVGGASDASGPIDLDFNRTNKYNVAVGIGAGALGLFWGQTSAIGRLTDIAKMNATGPIITALNAAVGAVGSVPGLNQLTNMSIFPNIGIAGANLDFNIPIPIPMPTGPVTFINIPLTVVSGASWDYMTWFFSEFLDSLKHEILDSVSAYSYSSSGGYAMDSGALRGEYAFVEKGALESVKNIPKIGPIDIGGMIADYIGAFAGSDELNNSSIQDRLLEQRHSYGALEKRDTDTGAFFSTAAFLSQFELDNMEYSYWTATHQNEEVANMDLMRGLLVSGKELMLLASKGLFGMSLETFTSITGMIANAMVGMLLGSLQNSVAQGLIWDLMFHDQGQSGFSVPVNITESSLKAEGYDFIEDDKKLYEGDFEAVSKTGLIANLVGSFKAPRVQIDGWANTRRYKPEFDGVDVYAGRQGYGNNVNVSDTSWDIHSGFWADSGLGDINEVYVRKNTVQAGKVTTGLSNAITAGSQVTTEVHRFVGSENRIFGRGYDGGDPLNLSEFRTGYFSDKYFGGSLGSATRPNQTVDGNKATIIYHTGKNYYDRKLDYTMKFTFAEDGNAVSLSDNAALAPTLGGRIKIADIDANPGGAANVLGADTTGNVNVLNQVLEDYLVVKADGSNRGLVEKYRDVFKLGFLDNVFVNASANTPMGGGVQSSIRISFKSGADSTGTATITNDDQTYNRSYFGGVDADGVDNIAGNADDFSGSLYLKNAAAISAEVYLDSFFSFRRRP